MWAAQKAESGIVYEVKLCELENEHNVFLFALYRTGIIQENLMCSGSQDSFSPKPSLLELCRIMPENTPSLLIY